ncbi:MAG: tetratricopeptide repeat protein [Balneolia bacterium]|nr:tetratricopeptide repeat protein [Balneolia bacterium]
MLHYEAEVRIISFFATGRYGNYEAGRYFFMIPSSNLLTARITLLILMAILLHPNGSDAQQASAPDIEGHLIEDARFVADVQKAIDLVYNQEFEASVELLNPWFETGKAEPIRIFWDGLPIWWDILADLESEEFDEAFITIMEQADRAGDVVLRRDRRNLDAMVIKALANGFLARLHANRTNWYKSLSHGRQAINLLFAIEQLYPDVPDVQFGLGLYKYFTAHLNDEYRLVRAFSWMVPSGDKDEGLERLTVAAEQSAFMRPEATYFLGHIYLHYEQESELAERYLTGLVTDYPHNAFFSRLMLRTYYQQRQYGKAMMLNDSLIERFEPENHAPTMEELLTMRGMLHYRDRDYDRAEELFEKVMALRPELQKGEARHQQMFTRYHLGLIYSRTGREAESRRMFRSVRDADKNSPLSDRARRMLRD